MEKFIYGVIFFFLSAFSYNINLNAIYLFLIWLSFISIVEKYLIIMTNFPYVTHNIVKIPLWES